MPIPGYPLDTNKVNLTWEVDDHPAHHNAVATALNWLSVTVDGIGTDNANQDDFLLDLKSVNDNQDLAIAALTFPGQMPVGTWFPAVAQSAATTVGVASAVANLLLTRVDAPAFDGMAVELTSPGTGGSVQGVVYACNADGTPGAKVLVASPAAGAGTSGLKSWTFAAQAAGHYWMGLHQFGTTGTSSYRGSTVGNPRMFTPTGALPPTGANAVLNGWGYTGIADPPPATLTGTPSIVSNMATLYLRRSV